MTSTPYDAGLIQRTQLHDEAVRQLRGLILRGEMPPGSRVHERALCEQFGISRTPLREALKVLASSGLVELWPNRGARIAPLRPDDVGEAFEVVSLLERRAGELAADWLDETAGRELRALHESMMHHVRRHDAENILRMDLLIHRSLVERARNATLAAVHESLTIKLERARYLVTLSEARLRQSMQEHETILAAILAEDPDGIAQTLYQHCLNTRDAVVAAVRMRFGDDGIADA